MKFFRAKGLFLIIFFSLTFLFASKSFAWVKITEGPQQIGDNRLTLTPGDFNLRLNAPIDEKIKVSLIADSFEWVRVEQALLVPRARIRIMIQARAGDFYVRYGEGVTEFQQRKKFAYTEFYVSLFSRVPLKIFKNGVEVGEVTWEIKKQSKKRHLVDYSCSRSQVVVGGMDDEIITLGCRMNRIGQWGSEKPFLEILWASANWTMMDKEVEDYHRAIFVTSDPVMVKIKHLITGEERMLTIKAFVPPRLHRLNTAYGFGPYAFVTTYKETLTAPVETHNKPMTPALMLYFNYKMSDTASLRGFEALVFHDSIFNNAGAYFANDVAIVMDNKLIITTLIGMQHLYFKFDQNSPVISEPIFPQGVEFLYKHAFGIENYIISGGLFLSPSESIDYQNLWIRWGQKVFWELNYIYWGKEEFSAKMWGLSIGLPLKGFF
jgi:hypothetical protein